jgi:hypothetical protein
VRFDQSALGHPRQSSIWPDRHFTGRKRSDLLKLDLRASTDELSISGFVRDLIYGLQRLVVRLSFL